MNNRLAGRKVSMFRCQIDPMIGPKPRNAFLIDERSGMSARFNDEVTGVIVTLENGQEHFVFGANIQSVRLEPLELPKVDPIPITNAKGPGRWPKPVDPSPDRPA